MITLFNIVFNVLEIDFHISAEFFKGEGIFGVFAALCFNFFKDFTA